MADDATKTDDKQEEFKLDRNTEDYKALLSAVVTGMAMAGRGSWARQAQEAVLGADAIAEALHDLEHNDPVTPDGAPNKSPVPSSPQVPPPQNQPIPPAQNPGKPTPAAPETVDANGNPLPPPAPEGTVDDEGHPLPKDGDKPEGEHTDPDGNTDKDKPVDAPAKPPVEPAKPDAPHPAEPAKPVETKPLP